MNVWVEKKNKDIDKLLWCLFFLSHKDPAHLFSHLHIPLTFSQHFPGYHNRRRSPCWWKSPHHTLWHWYDQVYLLWILPGMTQGSDKFGLIGRCIWPLWLLENSVLYAFVLFAIDTALIISSHRYHSPFLSPSPLFFAGGLSCGCNCRGTKLWVLHWHSWGTKMRDVLKCVLSSA